MVAEPAFVQTTTLGSHVGLIMYDPLTRQTVVAQLEDTESQREGMEAMLDATLSGFEDISRVKVYVRGNSPTRDPLNEEDLVDITSIPTTRVYVLEVLRTHGLRDITTQWWVDSDQAGEMKINTVTGEVIYDVRDYSDKDFNATQLFPRNEIEREEE